MAQNWRRIESNRQNSQLSTGPKTEEGKARSSQNARKHGLTSRELVIRPEEQELFQSFLADYEADLQPEGPLEYTLFNQIVHAAWNLRRVRELEAGLFTGGLDPLLDPEQDKKLDRLDRYARRFENSLHRGIRELRTLQTNRAQRASILPAVRETIPFRADTSKSVLRAKRTHPALCERDDLDLMLASIDREPQIFRSQIEANGVANGGSAVR